MVDFKNIETAEQMIAWAEAVNVSINGKLPDLQDVWGRSKADTLHKLILSPEVKDKRKVVFFSIQKAMGMDTFFDMLNTFINAAARSEFDRWIESEYDERMKDIREREEKVYESEKNLREERSTLECAISRLEEEVRKLKREAEIKGNRVIDLECRNSQLLDDLAEAQKDQQKYHLIKEVVKDLLS